MTLSIQDHELFQAIMDMSHTMMAAPAKTIDTAAVDRVLQAGVDANAHARIDGHTVTPLGYLMSVWVDRPQPDEMCDATSQRLILLDRLLEAGADPSTPNATCSACDTTTTPFLQALHHVDGLFARRMLERCPSLVSRHEAMNRPPLCVAIACEQDSLAMLLLEAGANPLQPWPSGTDGYGMLAHNDRPMDPVWLATSGVMPDVLDRLLTVMASTVPIATTSKQQGLYTLAINRSGQRLLPVLQKHRVPLSSIEQRNVVPQALKHAIPWSAIKPLIAQGADPFGYDSEWGVSLEIAAEASVYYDYMEPLMMLGADPLRPGRDHRSVLDRLSSSSSPISQAWASRLEQMLLAREIHAHEHGALLANVTRHRL